MEGNVVGYQYAINRNGSVVREGAGGWAIKPGDSGPAGGGPGIPQDSRKPMHIASLSKIITAMAFIHCMNDYGLTLDDFVYQSLPGSWTIGDCVGNINFRQLLSHKSGIYGVGSGYNDLKAKIASGVNCAEIGDYEYHNANFGLFRIIIPWITHYDELSAIQYDDAAMDSATRAIYVEYMEETIFEPAGLTGGGHDKAEAVNPTKYYDYGNPEDGPWDSDYEFPGIGGYGWFTSSYDISAILNKFLYSTTYVTAAQRLDMMQYPLGFAYPQEIDDPDFEGQVYYNKGGDWWSGGEFGRGLATRSFIFPNNVEVTLFINNRDNNFSSIEWQVMKAWILAWE